jgi:hypothetical protein
MYNIHPADLIQLLSDAVATSHVVCIERSSKIAKANVGGVEPGALADQPAPQIIEANLLRARFAERAVIEWPLVAQSGR